MIAFIFFLSSCLQVDVMFVCDYSGSVKGQEPALELAVSNFVSRFELTEETIKIGVAMFSDGGHLACPLTTDKDQLAKARDYAADGSTDMLGGLMTAVEQFTTNGRPGYKQIIILISDGDPDQKELTRLAAEQLKSFGVTIYGVLIHGSNTTPEYMQSISSYYLETDFERLPDEIQKLDICL